MLRVQYMRWCIERTPYKCNALVLHIYFIYLWIIKTNQTVRTWWRVTLNFTRCHTDICIYICTDEYYTHIIRVCMIEEKNGKNRTYAYTLLHRQISGRHFTKCSNYVFYLIPAKHILHLKFRNKIWIDSSKTSQEWSARQKHIYPFLSI